MSVATEIDRACREIGFFGIIGHGVDPTPAGRPRTCGARVLRARRSREGRDRDATGGRAWRGWFPVGGELTSGAPDQQGGHLLRRRARCRPRPGAAPATPLHGANLFPAGTGGARAVRARWLDEMRRVGEGVMRGIALGARPARRLVRRPSDRRPDGALPDLPLSADHGRHRRLGRRRTHRLRAAHGARPGLARRPPGQPPRRYVDRRRADARRCSCATSATCSNG